MFSELLKTALALVVSFGVRWLFTAIGVEVDEATFNAIVAGIVLWLLTQLGYGLTARAAKGTRAERFLVEEK